MMAPRPRSTMGFAAAWVASSMDLRSTAMTWSHSSSVTSKSVLRDSMPTLLWRMSTAPHRSIAALTIASQSALRVTLAAKTAASPPSCAISLAVSSAFSSLASTQRTRAPSRAKRMAAALPLPSPGPREPAPVMMATLSLSRPLTTCPCSRLERPVDAHVHEIRAARGEPAVHGGPHIRRLLHQLRRHAHRLGEADIVEAWVDQIHGDVLVVLGREALERKRPLLEDAVGRVVEDDVDDGDRVMRGGPERLDRVHGAAVTDQCDDGAAGLGELDAQRRRQPPADAAATEHERRPSGPRR